MSVEGRKARKHSTAPSREQPLPALLATTLPLASVEERTTASGLPPQQVDSPRPGLLQGRGVHASHPCRS